jgi:putative membrane-bound dehydrogenase-like protein
MKDGREITHPGKPGTAHHGDIVRPAGPIDPDVGVLAVRAPGGAVRGVVVNFACHCTVVGGNQFSADYVGYLRKHLKAAYGDQAQVVFLNGACGDITQVDNQSAARESGPEHADMMGQKLAAESIRTINRMSWEKSLVLGGAVETVPVRIRPEPDPAAEKPPYGLGSGPDEVYAAERLKVAQERERTPQLACEVQALRVGPLGIVTNGSEYFAEYALRIKQASPHRFTWFVELANEYIGYVPTAQAFVGGGYEPRTARSSKLAPEAGQKLLEGALRALAGAIPAEKRSQASPRDLQSPLSPKEELATLRVDPGLRVELVACEPEIQSPVAMAFDERGRLYVVEMLDYPIADPGRPPQGRIKLLEDKDGDGFYETSTVFADGLLMANGVMPWQGGVLVTVAPNILHLKDTQGEGRADRQTPLLQGFAAQNPQLRVSHPNLGLDNWIYVANGQRGGKIKRTGRDEAAIDINGLDFRFDLVHDLREAVSGFGQFGLTFDDWGQRFVCTNRNHLIHLPMANRYFARNPFLAPPAPKTDNQGPGGAARVYPISRNKTLAASHAGYFTAACGVAAYRGDLLPERYRNTLFTCEPTGNLVHQEVLSPQGATFEGRPAREGVEFLASPDGWFRPVFLTGGPDGAFYVVDFYRAEVEHPDWVPADLRYRYNFDGPKNRGRIWRIVPEGYAGKPPRLDLGKLETRDLVALLDRPNGWTRTTAQRLLLERMDPAAWGPLRELAVSGTPLGRLQAAWMLEAYGRVDLDLVVRLMLDREPRLRENGALLAERWVKESRAVEETVTALAQDPDGRVRFQAALTLGEVDQDRILGPLARIAERGADDRWTRLAIASAVPTRAGKLMDQTVHPLMLRDLATLVGSRRDPDEVSSVLEKAARRPPRLELAILNGLAEGMGRRGTQLGAFIASWPPEKRAAAKEASTLLLEAAGISTDRSRPPADRLEAARFLAHLPWEAASPALTQILSEDASPDLRLAAVAAFSAHSHPDVGRLLMASWKTYLPAMKREVLEAMSRQPNRLQFLLGEVEAGRLAGGELGPNLIRQLVGHPNAALRERARKILQSPEERQAVVDRYKPALSMPGDPARGLEVFKKSCTSCHRVAGVGAHVGPDISDTLSKTPEALLVDILDPSRVIDNNYVNYIVRTKSGAVLSGFIAVQTASSLTLRRGVGQEDVVLRQDIDEIKSSGVSLMPEGLEKNISLESMADLIAFLKRWRDLPPEPADRR